MKIRTKLFLIHFMTTMLGIVLLTGFIWGTIRNYNKEILISDINANNESFQAMIELDEFLLVKDRLLFRNDFINRTTKEDVTTLIFEVDGFETNLVAYSKNIRTSGIEFDQDSIHRLSTLEGTHAINIGDKEYFGKGILVQKELEGESKEFIIVSIVEIEHLDQLNKQIMLVLGIGISLFTLLLIMINRYFEKIITNPIDKLMKGAEAFSHKKFDEKVSLDTKDEFRDLAKTMNEMADSLKRQDQEQKQFYENYSHEIKTPLAVISGYAEGLNNGLFDNEDEVLDTIVEECNHLKTYVEDIIYLSKLDSLTDNIKLEKHSINQVIISALSQLDSLLIINEIDVTFEPVTDYELSIDNEKIIRTIKNVLSNCIRYAESNIYIQVSLDHEYVCIEIKDDGCGFSDEVLNDPFNRALNRDGNGIGLSIIKRIVDLHSGEIKLYNQGTKGAAYLIKLRK
jgi:signal transduction histidine kinase